MDYVKTAKRRAKALESKGVNNNALKAYKAMMNVAGDYATDKARQRLVKKVSRQFVSNELSTAQGIEKKYKRHFGEKVDDLKTASEKVDVAVKLSDEALRKHLGSEVLKRVFYNQSLNTYSTRMARNAMTRYFNAHYGEEFDEDSAVDDIITDLRERMRKRGVTDFDETNFES